MTGRRFQDIWKQQCEAALGVREKHGIGSALDYLIGEKLMTYADTAATRPEFARELPRFVAEIRSIFSQDEIRPYLAHLVGVEADQDDVSADPTDGDDEPFDTPERRAARRERWVGLRELLTANTLGTA